MKREPVVARALFEAVIHLRRKHRHYRYLRGTGSLLVKNELSELAQQAYEDAIAGEILSLA